MPEFLSIIERKDVLIDSLSRLGTSTFSLLYFELFKSLHALYANNYGKAGQSSMPNLHHPWLRSPIHFVILSPKQQTILCSDSIIPNHRKVVTLHLREVMQCIISTWLVRERCSAALLREVFRDPGVQSTIITRDSEAFRILKKRSVVGDTRSQFTENSGTLAIVGTFRLSRSDLEIHLSGRHVTCNALNAFFYLWRSDTIIFLDLQICGALSCVDDSRARFKDKSTALPRSSKIGFTTPRSLEVPLVTRSVHNLSGMCGSTVV